MVPILRAGMFAFTGDRSRTDILVNTEYESNPANRSGTSEVQHSFIFRGAQNV
jgi:hypothetical protein